MHVLIHVSHYNFRKENIQNYNFGINGENQNSELLLIVRESCLSEIEE